MNGFCQLVDRKEKHFMGMLHMKVWQQGRLAFDARCL